MCARPEILMHGTTKSKVEKLVKIAESKSLSVGYYEYNKETNIGTVTLDGVKTEDGIYCFCRHKKGDIISQAVSQVVASAKDLADVVYFACDEYIVEDRVLEVTAKDIGRKYFPSSTLQPLFKIIH